MNNVIFKMPAELYFDDVIHRIRNIFSSKRKENENAENTVKALKSRHEESESKELAKIRREKEEGLKDLMHNLSHNILAPIANIKGLCNLMERNDSSIDNLKLIIEYMASSFDRLDLAISDIAQVANMQIRLLNEENSDISLNAVFSSIEQSFRPDIINGNTTITSDFSKASHVFSNRANIDFCLWELVKNALKFKGEKPSIIEVSSCMVGESVCICVKDNGIGMDLGRNRDKLFKLYQRFQLEFPGRGTGLYTVKKCMEAIGGEIQVESRVNEGTEIRLVLPNRN